MFTRDCSLSINLCHMTGPFVPMRVLKLVQRWLYLGDTRTPAGSALLIEQFRILTAQVPISMAF